MNIANTNLFTKNEIEGNVMTISINASNQEIVEARRICDELGLQLEFVLDEF